MEDNIYACWKPRLHETLLPRVVNGCVAKGDRVRAAQRMVCASFVIKSFYSSMRFRRVLKRPRQRPPIWQLLSPPCYSTTNDNIADGRLLQREGGTSSVRGFSIVPEGR